ncbi:DUF6174 domain-containing protein [Actinoplanes sp. ATCC 53533]|uniref:DUF6174 domain-containing protein n=1 Tax=Actinoplanes sp. ATCC 53533 TaxID=1288362 RepID=UPI0018F43E4E|nr:DUF6174 domain-containing protein [Actinoplanes sp. ATCC 53533]
MRIKTVLPAMLLLTLTGACGNEPNIMEEASAPATWTVPAKYGFTLDSQCGERALIGRFQVTVQDDKVVRAEGLDDSARRALMLRVADLVPTLRQLEAQAESARSEGTGMVKIERDPGDAHPTKIEIDRSSAIDDEECYTIEDYTIGLASEVSPSPSR